MSKINRKAKSASLFTHEGGRAKNINAEQQLRRSVMNCLLWEKEFYEDGQTIADRILELCGKITPFTVGDIAVDARRQMHLRHVPLLLICGLLKHGYGGMAEQIIPEIVTRADQMGDLISLYWSLPGNKHMIPHAMQRGLQRAIVRFDEYQLAKYDRSSAAVSLRDVFRLVRPKPIGIKIGTEGSYHLPTPKKLRGFKITAKEQSALWKRSVKGKLKTPDTWEVALSGGADKKETFTRLLEEGKLGYFALLRNLRNMEQAGVDDDLVRKSILTRRNGAEQILPFRFIAAARAAPTFERELDAAMLKSVDAMDIWEGKTMVLVDVSDSMNSKLSARGDLTRMDAAAGLAAIVPAQKVAIVTFSSDVVQCPPRRGMACIDAIIRSQSHSGTYLGQALQAISHNPMDRLIVITDEQSHDRVGKPPCENAYMINVASAQNGVGYRDGWKHIDGFSENVLKWITEVEEKYDA